jgi:hypothetical protein
MGGGHYVLFERAKGMRESLRGARYESLKTLLAAQCYVDGVSWSDTPPVCHDFSTFRHDHMNGESLLQWQARHMRVLVSEIPWLMANPSPKTAGRVLFSRSLRYHSPTFPWDKALQRFRDPLFVGLPEEYFAFQTKWGRPIEHHTCANLLELAEMIAGCELIICNQSCPYWIAAGLGKALIQESWPVDPNSVVVRPNARYALNGGLPL